LSTRFHHQIAKVVLTKLHTMQLKLVGMRKTSAISVPAGAGRGREEVLGRPPLLEYSF
jgi:hypothetical protein